jgi:hypothetical protein
MKNQTIGIGIYLAVGLAIAGIVIAFAVSYFGDVEDGYIQERSKVEQY